MACDSGFISIVDPFLNPDGSHWTGSITYTLLYATTVAGQTIVNAEQQFNVVNGINLCLAPGLYNVQLQQSGFPYAVTQQWGVPVSGGPYTVAEISSNVTLQGSFGGVTLTGTPSAGQVPTAVSASAATWQNGGGGAGLLQVATVTITQAEVLAINDTPIEVVPAQGAGKVIFVTGGVVQVKGNANYTVDDQTLYLELGGNQILDFLAFGGSTGNANNLLANFAVGANGYFVNASLFENQPIMATTLDANPTGTGGDVVVTVYYVVLALP